MEHPEYPWIECGLKRPGYFRRNILCRVEELEAFRRRHGNVGVFATAYRYQNTERQGKIYAPYLYLDLDDGELAVKEREEAAWQRLRAEYVRLLGNLEAYYGVKRELVASYFSGAKGLSILVPAQVLGLEPAEDLNEVLGAVAADLATCNTYRKLTTLDLRIYDRVRLWRLPNSRHEASGLYKVRLAFDEVARLSLAEVRKLATSPRPDPGLPRARPAPMAATRLGKILERRALRDEGDARLAYEPPCIKALLSTEVGVGARNNVATALASHYRQRGLQQEEALAALLEWNRNRCAPSLAEGEVARCVTSVYRHGYNFGCQTFARMNLCKPEECRIARYRNRKRTRPARGLVGARYRA